MAQGSQKFKAQRPGGSKKPQQNKQKGPKKGGKNEKPDLSFTELLKKVWKLFLVEQHEHVTCMETAQHAVSVTPV